MSSFGAKQEFCQNQCFCADFGAITQEEREQTSTLQVLAPNKDNHHPHVPLITFGAQ